MCPLWQRGSTFVEEDLRACFQPRWIGRAVACAGIEGAVSFPFGFEGGEWWNRPTNTGLVHQRNHVELIASSGNVCLRNLNPTCTRLLEGVALMRHGERHFFSLSPFQNMHTAEKRRMEWWCFPRDCIDRSRVDFSDNCGHGGLRRLWWLSFCTFRCFGVNRKRGRRRREGGREGESNYSRCWRKGRESWENVLCIQDIYTILLSLFRCDDVLFLKYHQRSRKSSY